MRISIILIVIYVIISDLAVGTAEIEAKKSSKGKKKRKSKSRSEPARAPPEPTFPEGYFSPRKEGLYRDYEDGDLPTVTELASIKGGTYWYGTQMGTPDGKVVPQLLKDGAAPRVKSVIADFKMDVHAVTNRQFKAFVEETGYKTEAELFKWSFVLEGLSSAEVEKEVDGDKGMGRVREARHWMAVKGANWKKPYGLDSTIQSKGEMDHPVTHVSYNDAEEYCAWVGGDPAIAVAKEKAEGTWVDDKDEHGQVDIRKARSFYRLATEREWEYAARGGLFNMTYPWGNDKPSSEKPNSPMFNYWPGTKFDVKDQESILLNKDIDGYHGLAPAKHYLPNDYGLYQMLGNVWEWTMGGSPEKRSMRGGSFIDSLDGSFNHAVMVSTRQTNSGDSGAMNLGFRCVYAPPLNIAFDQMETRKAEELEKQQQAEVRRRQAKRDALKKASGDQSKGKGKDKPTFKREKREPGDDGWVEL